MRKESKQYHYKKHPWYQNRSERGSRPILTDSWAESNFRLCISVLQSLLREEAYCFALVGSSAEGRAGSAKTGASHMEKLFAHVGVGLYNLCWGYAPPEMFILVQGMLKLAMYYSRCNWLIKLGFEGVISNDSDDDWKSSVRWAWEIHISFKSKKRKRNKVNHSPSFRRSAILTEEWNMKWPQILQGQVCRQMDNLYVSDPHGIYFTKVVTMSRFWGIWKKLLWQWMTQNGASCWVFQMSTFVDPRRNLE